MTISRNDSAGPVVPFAGILNKVERTKGGAYFEPTVDHWTYRDGVYNVSLNFTTLIHITETLTHSLKCTLVWYAKYRAPTSLSNAFKAVQHFQLGIGATQTICDTITEIELLNYRASLNARNLYRFGVLSSVLERWAKLGYAGLSSGALKLLKELRTPGNQKGEAVLIWDPVIGPLTDIEYEALYSELNDTYANGHVSLEQYLLAWLFISLGQRSSQYASLKVCDVLPPEGNQGYRLNMPRGKQSHANSRASFTERPLILEIGEALSAHAADIKVEFIGRLPDMEQAPLFPSRKGARWSDGFEFHQTGEGIGHSLQRLLEKLEVHSERVNGTISLAPIRLRRTLGTRAAAEGHNAYVIAELLDHTDTQNVGVYSANSPAIIERIDRSVALHLAPIAQAFAGVLIREESEATRGTDRSSRIIDLRIDRSGAPMGSCSQYSFCGFSAPIACYTCKAFEPWLDGSHEAVFSYLTEKRNKLMDSTDKRIASVNDRTILAVAEVVRRVNEAKGKAIE